MAEEPMHRNYPSELKFGFAWKPVCRYLQQLNSYSLQKPGIAGILQCWAVEHMVMCPCTEVGHGSEKEKLDGPQEPHAEWRSLTSEGSVHVPLTEHSWCGRITRMDNVQWLLGLRVGRRVWLYRGDMTFLGVKELFWILTGWCLR